MSYSLNESSVQYEVQVALNKRQVLINN